MAQKETIATRGYVLVLSAAADPPARLVEALNRAGYALAGSLGDADIAIIDVRNARQPVALAEKLSLIHGVPALHKAPVRFAGVIVVASPDIDASARRGLRKTGELIFLRRHYEPLVVLVRQRLRLAVLANEAALRIHTIAALPARAAPLRITEFAEGAGPPRVLVAGAPSPLMLSVVNALRPASAALSCMFSAGQTMRALDFQNFDALVMMPVDDKDLLMALARALRRHRNYRRMPTIIIAPSEDAIDTLALRGGDELMIARNAAEDLPLRIGALVRRARLAEGLGRFLAAPEESAFAAADLPLWSSAIFAAHVGRRLAAEGPGRKPVALIGAKFAPAHDVDPLELSAGLKMAARMINGIIRREDMATLIPPSTIVILLTGALVDDAAPVARRIEGVLAASVMRSKGAFSTLTTAAVIEDGPGTRVEELLARLIRSLNVKCEHDRAAPGLLVNSAGVLRDILKDGENFPAPLEA